MTRAPDPVNKTSVARRSAGACVAIVSVLLALGSSPALAQEREFQRGDSQWGVGLAVDGQRKAYRETGTDTQGIPLVYFENYWIRALGPSIELKLPPLGPVALRLKARYALDGYEASDSVYLEGMAEREGSVLMGGEAIWRTPFLNLSAELLGDVSGHSEGRQFRLQADRRFDAGSFSITPRLAAVQVDKAYVGYYYGVTGSEVRPGRPQYEGDSAVNGEVGLRVDYRLTGHQTLFLDLRSTRLGDEIADSPLVDRARQTGLRAGYLYRF